MRRHLWAASLIVAAVCAAYGASLRNGFIGDDHVYIEQNPFVQRPRNLRILLDPRFYLGPHEVLVGSRPVFLASLMVDRALWGKNPMGFHATNVLLHAANSLWIYGLSTALGVPTGLGLWAGLFFGLHPVQTEAVDGISFRADLLAAFFVLFSLWAYLRARRQPAARAVLTVAGCAALFGLGLLSKETAAVLPALLLLLEAYFPSSPRRRLRVVAAMVAFALVACGFAGFWAPRFHYVRAASPLRSAMDRWAAALPTAPGSGTFSLAIPKARGYEPASWQWRGLFSDRRAATLTMVGTAGEYLQLLVFPRILVADRAPVVIQSWRQGQSVRCLLALAAVALFALLARRRYPLPAFCSAWFLIALLPVCNLIPLFNPVAERYLYFSTAAAAWIAASALVWLERRARLAALLAGCLLLLAGGLRTQARNRDWRDEKALYLEASAGGVPQSARANLLRGSLLFSEGRLQDAVHEYETAVRLQPDFAEAWLGLGKTYASLGDGRARSCYETALAADPGRAVLHFAYGSFLARSGHGARAVVEYRQALHLEPDYMEAWVNLGALLRDLSRFAEARACYERALSLVGPNDALPHYSYGTLLDRMGDFGQAAAQYRAALAADSSCRPAHLRLARIYARLGRRAEALAELRAAGSGPY